MKIIYFIKWLFDVKKWYGFQKRYTLYAIAGIVAGLWTGYSEFFWVPAILVWLDFAVEMILGKWKTFNNEQEQMLKDIKHGKGYLKE